MTWSNVPRSVYTWWRSEPQTVVPIDFSADYSEAFMSMAWGDGEPVITLNYPNDDPYDIPAMKVQEGL